VEEVVWGLLGFVALVHVWVYFCCSSGGFLCQGLPRLKLCTVGKIGCSFCRFIQAALKPAGVEKCALWGCFP
jgi:hypothetical protein